MFAGKKRVCQIDISTNQHLSAAILLLYNSHKVWLKTAHLMHKNARALNAYERQIGKESEEAN